MRRGKKKNLFQNLFLGFLGKSTSEKTIPPKKIGVPRCPSELEGQKGWHLQKTSKDFFTFFFAFRVNRPRRKRFRRKKIGVRRYLVELGVSEGPKTK
jgi:hypothetical protein